MHGLVHDFVVLKTIPYSSGLPSGFAKGVISDHLKVPATKRMPIYPKVLDIGSLDICGSQFGYDYCGNGPKWLEQIGCKEAVGIDIMDGKNVDIVMNAHDLTFESQTFDLVMCMNMIEHDSDPEATIKEAYRVLKYGCPFILTTVDETYPEHADAGGGDTETYNFITEKMFKEWTNKVEFYEIERYHIGTDLLFYGIK